MSDLMQEAMDWFEGKYVKGFVEGDPNFIDNYADNVMLVTGGNVDAVRRDEVGAVIDEHYVKEWTEKGLSDIAMIKATATVIGSQTVCIDARWKLLDDQGNSVAACGTPGWNYVLINTAGGWQVLAEIESDPMD